MDDTFTFTLDDETEKRLLELLTDVDVSKTPSFGIKDKHGNEAEYVKVIRCKDCYFYKSENLQCMMHDNDETEWYDNDYCSLAERRKE